MEKSFPQPSGFETLSSGMADASHYFDWVYHEMEPYLGRRILEVGPGYGNLAERILRSGREYSAVDTDADILSGLGRRLGISPDRLIHGDVSDRQLTLPSADTVISMNVLEHVQNDRGHLEALVRLRARLLLFVPAFPFLYGSMDREAGHYRRYTKKTLRTLLQDVGVDIMDMNYFNALGVLSWWTAGRLLHCGVHQKSTARSIVWYDRFVIPAARFLDPVFRNFIGQSLLSMVEARETNG